MTKFKFDGIIAVLLSITPFIEPLLAALPPGGKAALAVGALLKVVSFLRHFVPKGPEAAPVKVTVVPGAAGGEYQRERDVGA